jgi:hypothetical protein
LAGNEGGGNDHGTNSVRRVLETCGSKRISGESTMHLRGMSVSISIRARASGSRPGWTTRAAIDFVGEFKDGQMILARDAVRADGTKAVQRMVFKNITRNEFDWSWESSTDGGKTWKVQWPIHYKRKS